MFEKKNLLRAAIAATLTSGLAACGGGSSGGSSTPQSTSVTAIDGYLTNADVYIDANQNGALDDSERSSKVGTTNGQGVIQVPEESFEGLLLVEAVAGQTIDSDSGAVDETFVLSAPEDSRYVTPFTHLAQSTGRSFADIAKDLGVPESVVSGDYIVEQSNDDAETSQAAKIAHAVARFIVKESKKQTDIQTVSSNLIAAKDQVVQRVESGEDASLVEVELDTNGTITDSAPTKLAFSKEELKNNTWTMFRFDDAGDNEQMFLRLGTSNKADGMCLVNEDFSFINGSPSIEAPSDAACLSDDPNNAGTYQVAENGSLNLTFPDGTFNYQLLYRNTETYGDTETQTFLMVAENGELFWMDNNPNLEDAGDYVIEKNNTRYLFMDDNGNRDGIEYITGERQFTVTGDQDYTVNYEPLSLNEGTILFGDIGAAAFETTFDSIPAYLDFNQISAGNDDILVVRENASQENSLHHHFIYRQSGNLELILDYKDSDNSENLYLQSSNKVLIENIAKEVKSRNSGTQGD